MNIYFDFEEEMPSEQIEAVYATKAGVVLNGVKSFITQRIDVLNNETSKYPQAYIKLVLEPKLDMQCFGLPKDLSLKIIESIDQDNYDYMLNQIWAALHPGRIATIQLGESNFLLIYFSPSYWIYCVLGFAVLIHPLIFFLLPPAMPARFRLKNKITETKPHLT